MKRWLYRYRTVTGVPSVVARRLASDLRALLLAGTGTPAGEPAADGSFLVDLPAQVLGAEVTKAVRVRTGVATTHGARLIIPITWQAAPGRRAFPSFEGTLEIEELGRVAAQLTLVGAYHVPAGVVGLLVDSTLLADVAEQTADRLLRGLARALAEPADPPSPPAPPEAPLRVADVMTADPLVLADDQPLRTAALLLFHHEIGGAPVVDGQGGLVGVLSEADLVEKVAQPRTGLSRGVTDAWRRHAAATVGEACTRPARVTAADTLLRDAARELLDRDVARLVVVDRSRIAGIVTRHDVLRALLRRDEALLQAVQAVLDELGETDVRATVEWGTVTLHGKAFRLSRIRTLVARIDAIDGVVEVRAGDLGHHEDDITPGRWVPCVYVS